MRLDQINALKGLSFGALVVKALACDIADAANFPTADSLRLAIIEKTIEVEDQPSAPMTFADVLAYAGIDPEDLMLAELGARGRGPVITLSESLDAGIEIRINAPLRLKESA